MKRVASASFVVASVLWACALGGAYLVLTG